MQLGITVLADAENQVNIQANKKQSRLRNLRKNHFDLEFDTQAIPQVWDVHSPSMNSSIYPFLGCFWKRDPSEGERNQERRCRILDKEDLTQEREKKSQDNGRRKK